MKSETISRRDVIQKMGAAAGIAAFAPRALTAQAGPAAPAAPRVGPPTVVSNPPRDFTPGAQPATYPDPDIITIDPSFNSLRLGNTPIQRLWTGAYWCEGPRGPARADIWSGAIFRTIARCDISKTTGA